MNSIKGFITSLTLTDITLIAAIIILMILIIILMYVQKNEIPVTEEETKDLDLMEIQKDILKNNKPKTVDLTSYEEEQEEKAIISYEELLQNTGQFKLNYEEENYNDGLSIKKVDTENLTIELPRLNETRITANKFKTEEEYLIKLKQFIKELN